MRLSFILFGLMLWLIVGAISARAAVGARGVVQMFSYELPEDGSQFKSARQVVDWINRYRDAPQPLKAPGAIHALVRFGAFDDLDRAGLYIGFLAGVIGDNQLEATEIIERLFPMPPKQQAVIIRAIAYSGLPNWKQLLKTYVERMPARAVMADSFLYGGNKPLYEAPLDQSPDLVDALWGVYIATGYFQPVQRLMLALKWSSDKEDTDKFTVGNMALWSMAANAESDRVLLRFYRKQLPHQPEAIAKPLRRVIEAAERFTASKLKQEVVTAIAEQSRQKPPKHAKWAWGAKAGEVLLSIGCVAAGALGQVQLAAPCVVTSAIYSGVRKMVFDGK